MSKLETNTIDTVSGTSNLIIGSTNTSTITMPSGEVTGHMYPAFEAHSNANQSLTDNTYAKVNLQTEILDTDSNFSSSRFTPTTAGKYYFEGQARGLSSSNSALRNMYTAIYKNGSIYKESRILYHGQEITLSSVQVSAIIDMNGTSDYVELYSAVDVISGSASLSEGTKANYFLGYRLGT